MKVDALQLEPVLETLTGLDWVALLQEDHLDGQARYVLLADPGTTLLKPLFDALLLQQEASTENLWKNSRWSLMHMHEAL